LSIGNQIKSLARHSSVYSISTFIQRALGLIMTPVYTDTAYLADRSAYGDLALAYTLIAFLTIVYLYGMDSALLRYFFIGEYSRKDVYKTAFAGVLVNSLILSGLLILFAAPLASLVFGNAGYHMLVIFAAVILFFDSIGNLPYNILRAEERSATFSIIRIGRFLTELALNILFVVFLKKGVAGILYANILASILNLIVLLPFQQKYLKGKFNWDLFRTLTAFALPMLPNGLAYLTVEVSDKYLMRVLLDKDTLGVYSANYKFGSMMLLLVMAFRTAWQPFFLKVAGQENAKKIYAKVLTYFTLISVFAVTAGIYFIEYIVRLPYAPGKTIMGQSYWEGNLIIPIILTSYIFYGIYVNLTVGVYIIKKTRLMVLFTGLAALVNVGSNLYLMPAYGMMGAAAATLLSYITMAAAIFIANQKIYTVKYEYGRLLFLLILLAVMLFSYYQFDLGLLARIIIVLLMPLFLVVVGFFRKEEILFLKSLLKQDSAKK